MYKLIKNPTIINEDQIFVSDVFIKNDTILKIGKNIAGLPESCQIIDATGLFLFPGIIDMHVHFREPGFTNKGSIYSESRAAAAGGVTSFCDMPNTMPQTANLKEFNKKMDIAKNQSLINYGFYIGANHNNIDYLCETDLNETAGVKVFMGLTNNDVNFIDNSKLRKLFSHCSVPILLHCEEEKTIIENLEKYKQEYGDDIPMKFHSKIRSQDVCVKSTKKAITLSKTARNFLTGIFHICHVSTAQEADLINNAKIYASDITSETSANYLWFSEKDYAQYGTKIKCNPAIKTEKDRLILLVEALNKGKIELIASDHAPHTKKEKQNNYVKAPSGIPSIQHSFQMMLDLQQQGYFDIKKVAQFMSHAPANIFFIEKRGFIREGFFADLVLVDFNQKTTVSKENILYKCGWSPLEGYTFNSKIIKTLVNGEIVYENGEINNDVKAAKALEFSRK